MNKNINYEVDNHIKEYSEEIQKKFECIRNLVLKSVSCEIEEKMWAKLPSYYLDDKFIRIIPFKDHINIEAKGIKDYLEQINPFKTTPKGMLQIFIGQEIPVKILEEIFKKTLTN